MPVRVHRPVELSVPANSMTRSAYGYVYGNPLNATDPSGLWPWDGYCIHNPFDPNETCRSVVQDATEGHVWSAPEQFARANDGRLLAHEVRHTDQWLIFGWMFPSLDAEAAAYDWAVSKITGCPEGTNNIFEVWAGLKDGGYTR